MSWWMDCIRKSLYVRDVRGRGANADLGRMLDILTWAIFGLMLSRLLAGRG